MTAAVFKLSAGSSTNLTKIKDGPCNFKGVAAVGTAAYATFLKLYWFLPTSSAAAPTVGTTVPDMTIEIPALGTATGNTLQSFPDGITKTGNLYIAITKLAADSDTTAVVSGDALVSILYE